MLDGADILITGGTGSFGRALAKHLIDHTTARRVIIYSRDELKQFEMQRELRYQGPVDGERLRFFIGDVRDGERLRRALCGVDVVIHAAALKQVPACEYNPQEAVKTNVLGACNLIEAAIDMGVQRVVALSTDKACSPVNLYGATKLAAEKLFIAANALAGAMHTRFAVVRYGNVMGSRGSVVPLFRKQAAEGGPLTITSPDMTRFWITLPQAVQFVGHALFAMKGGEVFVPRLPTVSIMDIAQAVIEEAGGYLTHIETKVVGIRNGEKLHETLITAEEAWNTLAIGDGFVINGHPALDERADAIRIVGPYTSDTNQWKLTRLELMDMLAGIQ